METSKYTVVGEVDIGFVERAVLEVSAGGFIGTTVPRPRGKDALVVLRCVYIHHVPRLFVYRIRGDRRSLASARRLVAMHPPKLNKTIQYLENIFPHTVEVH